MTGHRRTVQDANSENLLMDKVIAVCEDLSILLDSNFHRTDQLLAIEETIYKLRAACQECTDRRRLSSEWNCWEDLSTSIVGYREIRAIHHILNQFDGLYSVQPEFHSQLAHSCLDLVAFLEGNVGAERPYSDCFGTLYKSENQGQKSVELISPLVQLRNAEVGERDSHFGEDISVDDVLFFLKEHRSSLHKVLVIGDEGKTHLCNEIDRRAGGNTRGMNCRVLLV